MKFTELVGARVVLCGLIHPRADKDEYTSHGIDGVAVPTDWNHGACQTKHGIARTAVPTFGVPPCCASPRGESGHYPQAEVIRPSTAVDYLHLQTLPTSCGHIGKSAPRIGTDSQTRSSHGEYVLNPFTPTRL